MAQQFQYLFSPIKLGPITLRNRIVSTPHGTKLMVNGMPTERLAYYHAERAKGGVGMTGIQGVLVAPESPDFMPHMIRGYEEAAIPGFRKIADMVHEQGAKIICELMNLGAWAGRAPSSIPDMWYRVTPREATIKEIESWVKGYAITARNMREAGMDGVEVHASHGVGVHQFNTPLYNRRTDKYGGSLEKRLTFLLEIIDCIRQEVGNAMALGVRLDVEEPFPGGVTLEDGKRMAQIIEGTGKVDYLSVDAALEPHEGYLMTASMYAPQGHMVYCAAAVKEVVESMPVLVAGRIVDPLHAEKILADGHADLVAMTRAQIADPELANKAREGRLDDIRPCLGDNENCIGRTQYGMAIACTVNPTVSEEKEQGIGTLQPAAVKKKVLVIGGGPAGMEAARTLALRGHRAVLYEKEDVLGGQIALAARLPGRDEIGGIVRWFKGQLSKLGVEIHLGEEFTAAKLDQVKPDAVVVATGATFFRDGTSGQAFHPISGWEHEHVTTPEEILSGGKTAGQRVIIVDETGFLIGAGLGELLVDQGKTVELLTSDAYFGTYLVTNQQIPWVYARIMGKVTLTPNTVVKQIAGRTVLTVNPYSRQERRIEDVDTVVLVTAKEPRNALYHELEDRVAEIYMVGDCDHAANARFAIGDAVRAGHRVGRRI